MFARLTRLRKHPPQTQYCVVDINLRLKVKAVNRKGLVKMSAFLIRKYNKIVDKYQYG